MRGKHISKRAFVTTAIIAACWLLAFAVVAKALGMDRPRSDLAALSLAAGPIAERGRAPEAEAGALGGTDAGSRPGSPRRLTELELVRFTAAILKPESLAGVKPELAKARALEWAKAVDSSGGSPAAALGEVLPSSVWFQARLVTKRDEPNLKLDAKASGEFGRAYAALQVALKSTKASSKAVEASIGEIWRYANVATGLERKPVAVLKRFDRWIPGAKSLKSSHQYALDVFFTRVKRHGPEERGPSIRSMSSGVVVSAAGDWKGGDARELYRSGGLSPNSGNGVIVYDPDAERYYAYFHLSDVDVRAGQIVEAGQQLGLGGNTGVNARKKGHGGHVHLEIHDAEGGAWSSYRIRDYLLSIH